MEFNGSTFVLEIINFLVLIWIMKHFFYKPVLDVIEKRRLVIEEKLAGAEALHLSGVELKTHYEARLENWEKERLHARDGLQAEVEEERVRLMAKLNASLEQAREKARIGEARRIQEQMNKAVEQALYNGSVFVTRLLEQTASEDMEERLIRLFLKEFEQLPPGRIESLRPRWGNAEVKVRLATAYSLKPDQQQQLIRLVNEITGPRASIEFSQDTSLLSGLRMTVDGQVLGLNLRDELRGYVELTKGA
ncbi:MAG: F0F1 ATP synthase subunit delta [Pontibacterium sp.]